MPISFLRGNSDFGRITDPDGLTAATISSGDKESLADTGEQGVPVGVEISPIYLYTSQSKMPRDSGVTQVRFEARPEIFNCELQNFSKVLIEDSAYAAGPPKVFNFRKDTLGESEGAIYSEGRGESSSAIRRLFAPLVRLTGLGDVVQGKTEWMACRPTYTILDPGLDESGGAIYPLQIAEITS